jgi:hypothetical protein
MILTSQFWDFISIYFYVFVGILAILAFIVDMLVLWVVWELIWHWLRKKSWFKKKGYPYD